MSTLKTIAKKLKKVPYVPVNDDPRLELRRLVQEHQNITRSAVAIKHMYSDRVMRETGEVIKSRVPADVREMFAETVKQTRAKAKKLEGSMLKELRKEPLWKLFLEKVAGCGPVTGAYLVAMVDFEKCVKPSALKRYCGFGVTDGHRDHPTKGQKLCYNKDLKVALWQMFSMGIRMAGRNSGSKYLKLWNEKKATLTMSRIDVPSAVLDPKQLSAAVKAKIIKTPGWVDATARRKATDVFLEDLYIVGRTLLGLPVWPSWYAKAMGYEHGGKVAVLEPKVLTIDDALEIVGVAEELAAAAE